MTDPYKPPELYRRMTIESLTEVVAEWMYAALEPELYRKVVPDEAGKEKYRVLARAALQSVTPIFKVACAKLPMSTEGPWIELTDPDGNLLDPRDPDVLAAALIAGLEQQR